MAIGIKDIGANAVEDGVEDYFQSYIYRRMQKLTKPFLKDYESDSEFDEAMQSFINTLSFGLALYALTTITTFFFTRGAKLFALMWGYIVAGALKNKVLNKLKNSPKLRGKKMFKKLNMIMGGDRTSDRIEIAKMGQENVKSYDNHKFHYQNQHQGITNSLDNFSSPMTKMKSTFDMKSVELLTHLTLTGKWTSSIEHKKIYEKAMGKKLSQTGQGSWGSLYQELNKFNQFNKTVDGEITNLTTVLTKILSRGGMVS